MVEEAWPFALSEDQIRRENDEMKWYTNTRLDLEAYAENGKDAQGNVIDPAVLLAALGKMEEIFEVKFSDEDLSAKEAMRQKLQGYRRLLESKITDR